MTGTVFSARALAAQLVRMLYPVGVYLDFDREIDPNTAIGCGTVWQRVADGRTLIASDTAHPVGWTGGENTNLLTLRQIPAHAHKNLTVGGNAISCWNTDGTGDANVFDLAVPTGQYLMNAEDNYNQFSTGESGGSEPHNNMQPSLAVCRWVRVA